MTSFMNAALLKEFCFIFRATIKGKIFQLRFLEEINPDSGKAERSKSTGHLVVILPRAKNYVQKTKSDNKSKTKKEDVKKISNSKKSYLEVNGGHDMDFSKIVAQNDDLGDLPDLEPIPN